MLLFESLRWTLYVLGKELWDKSNVELISIHLTVLNSDINRLLSKSKNYPLIFHWYENFTFFCRTEWNGKVKLFFSQKSCCSNFRADTILICSCAEKIKLVLKTNIELIWSECVFEAYSIIYKLSASRTWGNRSVQKLYTKLPWLGSKEIRRHHFEELIFRSLEWKGWYSGSRLQESWVARDKREIPRESCQKRKRLHELSVTSELRDSRGSRLSRARAVVRGYLVLSRLSYAFRYQEISYLRVPYFFSLRDLLVVKNKI